ncbi:hypothetical protein MHUMG1_09685 [Metarhizium humberi]|uniref:Uncharacterized protein n=1 Tax=Metarhizium humberi TaxID=2596975 RepID=A0A9P8S3Q8_9HYPO|nr:hypothetical protein MHUMG1_09685 [Metarhizium humberi]
MKAEHAYGLDGLRKGKGAEGEGDTSHCNASAHVGGSIDAGDGTRGGGGAGYDIQGSCGGAEQCGGACGSGADPKVDQTGKSVTAAKSRGKMPRDARQNHSFVRVLSASWLYAATVTWAS